MSHEKNENNEFLGIIINEKKYNYYIGKSEEIKDSLIIKLYVQIIFQNIFILMKQIMTN